MKIFVWDPEEEGFREFDDTEAGRQAATQFCLERKGIGWHDLDIVRGERLKFVEPSSYGQLVPVSD